MPASLPPAKPTVADLERESDNAAEAVEVRPLVYDGEARKPSQADDVWLANVAYWMTYPSAPKKIGADDEPAKRAWKRIRGHVNTLLLAQTPVAGTWNAAKITWPLATKPRPWGPGATFGARRPWGKDTPQTRFHAGTDIGAPHGTPVLAPEPGSILEANSGWETKKDGTGVKAIVMVTDSGKTILIGGIIPKSATVKNGARVKAGQEIAVVGSYPGGDSMAHVQIYDRPLTIAELTARKKWPIDKPRPEALIDSAAYLTQAAMNPKFADGVGLFPGVDPEAGALVDNDVAGGEKAEGEDDEGGGVQPPAKKSSGTGAAVAGGLALLALVGVGVGLARRRKRRR